MPPCHPVTDESTQSQLGRIPYLSFENMQKLSRLLILHVFVHFLLPHHHILPQTKHPEEVVFPHIVLNETQHAHVPF
jgi:hypothetical protein